MSAEEIQRRAPARLGASALALLALAGGASAQDESVDDLLDDLFGDEFVEEDEEVEGDVPAPAKRSYLRDWKGYFEVRPRYYTRQRDQGRADEQLLLEGELELDFRFGGGWTGYFRPRLFLDATDGDLQRFEPFEGYFTYATDRWDFRAGQFVENWGIVDTYNPIDVVNRRDFATDVLDADRLGELGTRLRLFLEGGDTIGEPTVSLYLLPVFRETRFATEAQRFGFGPNFDENDGFEPDGREEALVATRFQSTFRSSAVDADVQALVAYGPDRTPNVFFGPGGRLLPAYFGARTFGFGFRAVPNKDVAGAFLATLTLKAEVVYKNLYAFDGSPIAAPEDFLAYVVGIDRVFYNVATDVDQLTTTVEYAGETGADDSAALLRPFRNDVIARALWEANDFARQSFEVRALFDLDVSERIFEGIYERQLRSIHEDLRLIVQAQVFDEAAPGESFFGFFPNGNSLAVGLRLDL